MNVITWFDHNSIKDILSCQSGNYQVAPTVADMPLTGRYWHVRAVLTSDGGECTLRAEDVVAGVIYTQAYSIGAWHGWIGPYTTATPPQEHDFPLAAGIAKLFGCTYRKFQNGFVGIEGRVTGTNGAAIPAGLVSLGVLPFGYRPRAGDFPQFAAAVYFGGACPGWVDASGNVMVYSPGVPASTDPTPANWPGFGFAVYFQAS